MYVFLNAKSRICRAYSNLVSDLWKLERSNGILQAHMSVCPIDTRAITPNRYRSALCQIEDLTIRQNSDYRIDG